MSGMLAATRKALDLDIRVSLFSCLGQILFLFADCQQRGMFYYVLLQS